MEATTGGNITVSLVLENAADLAAAPMQIKFDPKVLRMNDVVKGDLLGTDAQQVIFTKNITERHRATPPSTSTACPAAARVSGSGTLVTLTFQAVAPRRGHRLGAAVHGAQRAGRSRCVTASPARDGYGEMRRRKSQSGLTLVELIVAFTIMFLLTSMAVPLARSKVRQRAGARAALRPARDAHRHRQVQGHGGPGPARPCRSRAARTTPRRLEQLVEGVKLAGQVEKKIRFLRRIPKDPFTNSTDWGKRSTQDDPKIQQLGRAERV